MDNMIVILNNCAQCSVLLTFVKETMLMDIGGKELLNIPYFNTPGETRILNLIQGGLHSFKDGDNHRPKSICNIGLALIDQKIAYRSCTVNNRFVNYKITTTGGRGIGNGSSMNLKRTFRQN